MRAAEERQSFLIRLGDATRPLAGSREIQATAADLLGAHLRVNQAHYGETIGESPTKVSELHLIGHLSDEVNHLEDAIIPHRTRSLWQEDVAKEPLW